MIFDIIIMRRVFQKNIGSKGDCLAACVASILNKKIDDVPNFYDNADNGQDFWRNLRNFLGSVDKMPWFYYGENLKELLKSVPKNRYFILCGPPNAALEQNCLDRLYHAYVAKINKGKLKIVHDPAGPGQGSRLYRKHNLYYGVLLKNRVG